MAEKKNRSVLKQVFEMFSSPELESFFRLIAVTWSMIQDAILLRLSFLKKFLQVLQHDRNY